MTSYNVSALSLQGLSFCYGRELPLVLRDISLDVAAGSITALLGPNGSGKTTLLHVLLGLLAPASGQVLIGGKPHRAYSRKEMSRLLGLVPQDERVTFNLSVLEYVLLGRAPYLGLLDQPTEKDRQIAWQALTTAGIQALRDRPVPELSGGERQLAIVARALAQEPAILLLDEPTSHLDLSNSRRVLRVLKGLRDLGKTIVFTTHDPNSAAAISDYVVLLREGRVLAADSLSSVFTAERLSATYGIEVDVIEIRGRPLVVTH